MVERGLVVEDAGQEFVGVDVEESGWGGWSGVLVGWLVGWGWWGGKDG